jgi:hypothetical protein
VTVILTVPEPGGVRTVQRVLERHRTSGARMRPNATVVARRPFENPVPMIVAVLPPRREPRA